MRILPASKYALFVLVAWAAGSLNVLAEKSSPTAQKATAKLERLKPSRSTLQAPEGVEGDYKIAQTPAAIDFAVFPGQWEGARLWSSWGDALWASDGNVYTSIGDHGAPYGTAYVYRVDPESRTIERVVDYNAIVGLDDQDKYAPGKIHCPLVEGQDGKIYFFGYRGSVRRTTEETGYRGDWLLSYDTQSGRTENLGIAVPFSSVPVLAFQSPAALYGLSVPGKTMLNPRQQFFHYDLKQKKPAFTSPLNIERGPRTFIVAKDGRVWFGRLDKQGEGRLTRYDPQTQSVTPLAVRVPGDGMLRAASRPDSEGIVYCISKDGIVFAFDTKNEKITKITRAFVSDPQYTATCRLGPSGRYLYYIPGAHGRTSRIGTPVIQLDVHTGERKVLAFLNEYLRSKKKYNLGGTYGIAVSEDGSQLFVNWNGSKLPLSRSPDFGLCAAMILHIPESERGAVAQSKKLELDSKQISQSVQKTSRNSEQDFIFRDVTKELGLLPQAAGIKGHAAGWGDVDGNGWPDLYIGTFDTGGSKPNLLFRNQEGQFRLDPQKELQISTRASGAVFADLDNDGDLDLYVSSMPKPAGSRLAKRVGHPLAGCSLFRNNGKGEFTNISEGNGACPQAFGGRSATVLDFDGDGLLDLLVGEDPFSGYNGSQTTSSRLFQNQGGLQFRDVTQEVGIPLGIPGLGVASGDVNNDGWPDLFLACSAPGNRLFLNDGQGHFSEAPGSRDVFSWKSAGGDNMVCGVCFGDVNNDGLLDIVIGQHFERPWREPVANPLYLNRGIQNGVPRFEEVTQAAGLVPLPMKSPHVEIQDFDNDGRPDILTSIVKFSDGRPHPVIFRNLGTQNNVPRFRSTALDANDFPTSADRSINSSGAFFDKMIRDKKILYTAPGPSCDFDRDGRLDMFLGSWWPDMPSLLLQNETPAGHWLQVRVSGKRNLNTMGIGSRVLSYEPGRLGDPEALLACREIAVGYGYTSCQEPIAHLGLGRQNHCDVEVVFPHGLGRKQLKNVKADQRITVQPGASGP